MTGATPAAEETELHPAAQWAVEVGFTPEQVDCTTTVVLKILDNKCKMLPGEKAAVMAVYDAVRDIPAPLFDEAAHEAIGRMRRESSSVTAGTIHELRVQAEADIPKAVMKRYKAFLREGLFG